MRAIAAVFILTPFILAGPARADETPASIKAPAAIAGARGPTADKAAGPGGPSIEVTFVLDATGSMGPYIHQARQRIKGIAEDLATGDPKPLVRFALVNYRDRGDDYVTRVQRFSRDIETMRGHLDQTRARGGGDTPEAVLEGLHAAITKLDWTVGDGKVLKLIYLVGDAPAKHYEDGPTEKGVAAEARKRGIVIHTITCGSMDSTGTETFDRLARLTEGRPFHLRDVSRGHYAGSRSRGGEAAPTASLASLETAVSGSARAYSASVGVDYDRSAAVAEATAPVPVPAIERSGLLGAHVRWIRDPIAWADLWAAHTSLLPAESRPPVPEVDFATHHVLVAGGAGGGLAVSSVERAGDVRSATVRPAGDGKESDTVSFVLIPATAGDHGGSR